MKKTKKILFLGLMLFVAILILPYTVNAATTIDSSNTPKVRRDEYGSGYIVFEAKGKAITISDSETTEGGTTISWGEDSQEFTSSEAEALIVVGGYWNPATESATTVDIESTSITMTGGTVSRIIGGNFLTSNYDYYSKINVDTIDITVTGGTFEYIFGLNSGKTALGAAYYDILEKYYTAGKVNVSVSDVEGGAIFINSSYTYVETANITLDNVTLTDEYGIAPGSNGKITTLNINVNASTVTAISSGCRAMVDEMNVTVTGTSTIGDIYAGSYYPASATHTLGEWPSSIGDVNYGQVGKMTFNLGENVTYNNIYAGFQFVDKDSLATTYAGTNSAAALTTTAAGIEGSENAPVTINTYNAPSVTDTDLTSMFDSSFDNVTIPVQKITVDSESDSIKVWDTVTLSATVVPTVAKDTSVTWSTSDSSVATVTEEGVVEGVSAGTVTITATAADGSKVTGTYEITVEANYEDVISEDLWYYDAVKDMYQQGIMTGIGDGTNFAPNNKLTRGMIVTILYRLDGEPTVNSTSTFSDVTDSSKYYYDAVVWAAENGIVTGYGSTGMFKPNQSASRQELALILYRYAGEYKGLDVSTTGSLDSFPDASSVSSWAEEAVEWAVGEGIIQGVSSSGKMYIKPTSTVTRAQAATMISRFIANVE